MRILLAVLLFMVNLVYGTPTPNTTDFVITVKTDNLATGSTGNTSFKIPTKGGLSYNYRVDWKNDGSSVSTNVTGDITHDFGVAGTYTIRISGAFPQILFPDFYSEVTKKDNTKLLSIEQWGTNSWTSFNNAFAGCKNLVVNATDAPNLSKVYDLSGMFSDCTNFNSNIGSWNTSSITDMSFMFLGCTNFNRNIGSWNTGLVTNMSAMFAFCTNFNSNIESWNTSSVIDMYEMFYDCINFNQDISKWNTRSATNMGSMFLVCTNFNQSLGNWNIANVEDMSYMLNNAGISFANYDATLTGWQASAHKSNIRLDAAGLSYCAAAANRGLLTETSGWTISGDRYLNTATSPSLISDGIIQTNHIISCINVSNGFIQFLNNAASPTLKFLAVNPNSNTGYNFSLTAANNSPAIGNQMRTDGMANTTALGNRIYTISDAGINNYPLGMTVRIYYSPGDSIAATSALDQNIHSPVSGKWFKFSGCSHTNNVHSILASQTTETITDAIFLTPSAYGVEAGISYVEFSKITSFSSFGFLAAKIAKILPIKLTSFTATANKCAANLVWQVAHEENSSYYAVETSSNGREFTEVAKIVSNNSANGADYKYTYKTDNGIHYFRLRSVDGNGKFAYSAINFANINCTNASGLTVSPNPTSEKIIVQGLAGGSIITLYDLTGKILMQSKATGSSETIKISKYAKGIYLLQVKAANGESNTIKLIRQ